MKDTNGKNVPPWGKDDSNTKEQRRFNVAVLAAGGLLLLAAVVAVYFAFRFVDQERERDFQAWQVRLGIVANSRAAAVNEWVERNFSAVRELTENASLQLYLTELVLAGGSQAVKIEEPAEAGYLRNLLVATAERNGFKPPPAAGEVAANVKRVGVAGMALVNALGDPLVSTPAMPPINERIRAAVRKALAGEPAVIDIYLGASNRPTIGFVLPIYGIQDDGPEGIGAAVGVRLVDADFYKRLIQPGQTKDSAKTYIVRRNGGVIEYLSPLAGGIPALTRSMAADTPGLAAAFAVDNPGGFAVQRDYSGADVLVTGRSIKNLPWTLVHTVAQAEALAETETRLRAILAVFVLIVVGTMVTVIAVWFKGSSLRATKMAEQYRIAAERFESLICFMRLVTDSQPTHIVCTSSDNRISFANRPFAAYYGISITDIRFKPLSSVMGPVKATALSEVNQRVISRRKNENHLYHFEESDGTHVSVVDHVYIPPDATHPPVVLCVIHDITELNRERERNELMMRQLVDTLVSVVDRRDPFSANHSARVAEVAREIASEMGLSKEDTGTVDIAGSLLSLGKILVSQDLLTKVSHINPEERKILLGCYMTSAELLEGVDFDGPVVETIRQVCEKWDGSGALGLAGEDILETARILSVANAFVGMVSARAYRDAITFENASDALLSDAGGRYDRRPVSALINLLDNRGGAAKWAHFQKPSEDGLVLARSCEDKKAGQ